MKRSRSLGTRVSSGSTSINNITSSCPTQSNPFDVTFQHVLLTQQFTKNNFLKLEKKRERGTDRKKVRRYTYKLIF